MRALLNRRRTTPAAMALLVLALGGCSDPGPGPGTGPDPGVERAGSTAAVAPGERWHVALETLGRGESLQAEELFAGLRESPRYGDRARHMLDQIRRPVHRYFPDDHFSIQLRAGQTLSGLSRRYLGDPLEFFALARYNGIAAPNRVIAGQLIRIPLTEHARRVRTAETGSPEADDPIPDPPGAGATNDTAAGAGDGDGTDTTVSDGERERIHRYYREATIAFQQQDLDRTLRYCERVLQLDADHENCLAYRDRARKLQSQLNRIQQEEGDATAE